MMTEEPSLCLVINATGMGEREQESYLEEEDVMKKKLIIVAIVLFVSIVFYFMGYLTLSSRCGKLVDSMDGSTNLSEYMHSNAVEYPLIHIYYDDVYGKIDYPLMDIYFDSNSNWTILKSDKLYTDIPEYYIINNASSVERIKEKISVLTFPVGRGTTESGSIRILRDGILIKEVPYIDSHISDDNLVSLFRKVHKDEIKELLEQ